MIFSPHIMKINLILPYNLVKRICFRIPFRHKIILSVQIAKWSQLGGQ